MSLNTSIAKHKEAIQMVINSKTWIPLEEFFEYTKYNLLTAKYYIHQTKEWCDGYVMKKEKGRWAYGCIEDFNEWKESRGKK